MSKHKKIPKHVLDQAAEAYDPEAFLINPDPKIQEKWKGQHFLLEDGKTVVTLDQVMKQHPGRFTITFGVDACTRYCTITNPALERMDNNAVKEAAKNKTTVNPWQHFIIDTTPEWDGQAGGNGQPRRIDGMRGMIHNVLAPKLQFSVLYPVDYDPITKSWKLSNKAAADIQNKLGSLADPSLPKSHDALIRTYDAQGNALQTLDPVKVAYVEPKQNKSVARFAA